MIQSMRDFKNLISNLYKKTIDIYNSQCLTISVHISNLYKKTIDIYNSQCLTISVHISNLYKKTIDNKRV